MRLLKSTLCASTALLGLSLSCAANAQSAGNTASSETKADDAAARGGLTEIVVTATKQGEVNLQRVPSSIQVLTSEALQQQQIQGFGDYARQIPSLSSINQGPGQTQIVLRGVTTGRINHSQPQNKSTTGLYIDEIPVSAGAFNPDLALFDVTRIEVLRGPQGTLYGAGAMSGAIRILTNQPKIGKTEGLAEGTVSFTHYGDVNYATRGVVNLPLADSLALRMSGYYEDNGGYIDNVYSGKNNYNSDRTYGGRASLLFNPGEGYSVSINVLHQNLKANGRPDEFLNGNQQVDLSLPAPYFRNVLKAPGENTTITGPYQTVKFLDDPFRDKFTIVNGVLASDLGFANLTSSTSYLWRDADNALDDTYRNRKNQGRATQIANGRPLLIPFLNNIQTRQFSNETRLASPLGKTIEWVAGVFFARQKDKFVQSAPEAGLDDILLSYGLPPSVGFGADPNNVFQGRQTIDARQYAAFGEVTVNASDMFSALVGLRYYHYNQGFGLRYAGIANDGVTTINTSITEDGFNPKFQLNFKPKDKILIYVQAAKGFRLGGINEPLPTAGVLGTACPANTPRSFGSDSLWNYELGFKGQTENRRATLNVAAFQIDWDNIQTSQFLPCNFTTVVNAGKARIRGLEGELRLAPVDNLVLSISGSYTDAKLIRVTPAYTARVGERLPNVPKLLLNASVDYTIPLANNSDIYVRANIQHQGNSYADFRSQAGSFEVPKNTSADFFAGYRHDPWELSVFVKNVTDERIVTAVDIDRNTPISYSVAAPRTIGITGRLRY
jgi:iron complex outermembrane recepter protein